MAGYEGPIHLDQTDSFFGADLGPPRSEETGLLKATSVETGCMNRGFLKRKQIVSLSSVYALLAMTGMIFKVENGPWIRSPVQGDWISRQS